MKENSPLPTVVKSDDFLTKKMRRFISARTKPLKIGQLTIILPDDTTLTLKGDHIGPIGQIRFHSTAAYLRMLLGGPMGLAESYLRGEWSSPNLESVFLAVLLNPDSFKKSHNFAFVRGWIDSVTHFMRQNSKKGARRNIAYHYDLGNAFFEHWLDPSMTYSSAWYENGATNLEQAQNQKMARICKVAAIEKQDHVLEIGCGWGGFAEYAALQYGANIHGITLSQQQLSYANKRFATRKISHLAKAFMTDYRDVKGQFDKIISIEMFEAVGKKHWPDFFRCLHDYLKPGGIAVLQIITIDDKHFAHYSKHTDFIQKYIFPGGFLPSPNALAHAVEKAYLRLDHTHFFGKSYAKTCRKWGQSFQAAWPRIEKLGFDRRFKYMWEYYLSYCAAGFEAGHINVGLFKITRPK